MFCKCSLLFGILLESGFKHFRKFRQKSNIEYGLKNALNPVKTPFSAYLIQPRGRENNNWKKIFFSNFTKFLAIFSEFCRFSSRNPRIKRLIEFSWKFPDLFFPRDVLKAKSEKTKLAWPKICRHNANFVCHFLKICRKNHQKVNQSINLG